MGLTRLVILLVFVLAGTVRGISAAEPLYNGIVLPSIWPPQQLSLNRDPLSSPSYLVSPPTVIPIDVGRQLFVDDFLIESTTLQRKFRNVWVYSLRTGTPD